MPYPIRLVPTQNDLIIQEPNLNHVLCRWVSPDVELKDPQGKLSAEAIQERQFFGYSVNKIPPSDITDITFSFFDNDKFNTPWNEGTDGYIPTENEYEIVNRSSFLIKIGDIHNYESEYPYQAGANKAPKRYLFRVIIAHKPLISNISHFEFDIKFYDINGDDVADVVPGKSSVSRKIIMADLRQYLSRTAKFSLAEF